ncbi:MAG: O-antigen ligase family protein [Elusimicrobia bacterium]|nr:O-antigen ligase family protein [Elusimicrobiota bacterium]
MQQTSEKTETRNKSLLTSSLVTIFFVSPLLFFTDLTRNPYYLQITLLNAALLSAGAVLAVGAARKKSWELPANILYAPLAAMLAVSALSLFRAYFSHAAFFRPAIASEGTRVALFTFANCALVFLLAQKVPFDKEPLRQSTAGWLALIFIWGGLWLLFPELKASASGESLFSRFWDPYGGFLWLAGAAAAWFLARNFNQEDFLHLAMAAGAIASLYGVLQYFQLELIWPKILNPYGNRSVSTFGNPNFISSYLVMLLPFVLAYLLAAKRPAQRFFYGFLFLIYEAMLMASLTRSSWIGAAAALAAVFAFREYREKFLENRKFMRWFFAAALVLLVLWPANSLKPFTSGLAERFSEGSSKMLSPSAFSLDVKPFKVYASFHQRLLIWSCAWQMGLESPLLGKGWGLFELFYPFYQGALLYAFEPIRPFRTHANNAHNELLEVFSQAGLLGLGIYVWLLAVLAAGFYRHYKNAPSDSRYWIIPFAAAMTGMYMDNLFNVSLHFAVPAFIFWWLLGAFSKKLSGAEFSVKSASSSLILHTSPLTRRMPALNTAAAVVLAVFCVWGINCWRAQFMREVYYFKGFKVMRKNDFAGAAAALKKAYDSHPREVNSNYEMGNAYVRAGDLAAAKWAYGEALNSNAGYDEIYFNLAIVNKKLGETALALDNLKVSAFINPLNNTVFHALAELYVKDADVNAKEAAEIFESAVGLFPADANLLNTLGYFYTRLKDSRRAKESYARAVKLNPRDTMLVQNLFGVAAQLGLKDDADLRWFKAYKEVEDKLLAGDASSVQASADRLVALDPGNLHALGLRAKVRFKAGNTAKAKEDLLAILAADPRENNARYGLAVVYEKEGDFENARREWDKILAAEPNNAAAAEHLSKLPQ